MHADPARRWTVEQIAREVGTSRSALAELFTELLDEAPMHYLARWRIHLARQLLREPARSIPDVAAKVGYESEAAFNRAFKRLVGTPPAAWRRAVGNDPKPRAIARPRPSVPLHYKADCRISALSVLLLPITYSALRDVLVRATTAQPGLFTGEITGEKIRR
jgi:AraC-like DNA-binding protein